MLLLLAENNYVLRITSEVLPKDKNEIVSQWLHKSFRVQSFSPWVLRVLIPPRSFSPPIPSRPVPAPSLHLRLECDDWQALHLIGKRAPHRGDVLLERARIDCWMITTSAGFISRLALFVRLCPISLFSLSCVCFEWTTAGALFWGSFTVIGHYLHRCELCLSTRHPAFFPV